MCFLCLLFCSSSFLSFVSPPALCRLTRLRSTSGFITPCLLVWMLPLNFGWAYLSSCNAREAALILISTLLCHVPPLVVSILSLKLFFRYNNYPLSFSYIIFSKQQSLQIGVPWTLFGLSGEVGILCTIVIFVFVF
jgi:hypothetical protein